MSSRNLSCIGCGSHRCPPHHPLLTPSGRAFAIGGKVQNISSDPLNPCIMFWPLNEPFPHQSQIRPSALLGIPQPPILNTGNRGPISHVRLSLLSLPSSLILFISSNLVIGFVKNATI